MTEIALKLFKFPAIRILRVSPLVSVALLPMLVLAGFILVILWVSFQTGVIGTAQAQYTLDNYRAVFADPLAYGSLLNTLVSAFHYVFYHGHRPAYCLASGADDHRREADHLRHYDDGPADPWYLCSYGLDLYCSPPHRFSEPVVGKQLGAGYARTS
jgi:hypothetical protein